ncbi:NAD-dependent epimerase/dehydratase family protein [Halodurantibacterium flavum]|uniref:NAD-dependent epimerase/dehydratase family protein n=1 Tax=Halodurantibacterium flavum TaxID=1382802 RepID=A0ABW4S7K4_9RHOB
MPPLLVTGATGRVGRLLCAALTGRVTLLRQTRHEPVPPGWMLWRPGMGFPATAGGGVLLHLAGPTPSGQPGSGPWEDHRRLALAAVRAARDARMAHALVASSAAIYGPVTAPAREDDPPAPHSDYARAKLEMERAVADIDGIGVTFLRIGNVAGTDLLMRNALRATPAAPLMLDRFPRAPRRAYIGPGTLAEVILTLAAKAPELPQVLNIAAPGGGVGMDALLDALDNHGITVPRKDRPAPPGALADLPLCTARLEAIHSFSEPEKTAQDMIAQWMHLRGRT